MNSKLSGIANSISIVIAVVSVLIMGIYLNRAVAELKVDMRTLNSQISALHDRIEALEAAKEVKTIPNMPDISVLPTYFMLTSHMDEQEVYGRLSQLIETHDVMRESEEEPLLAVTEMPKPVTTPRAFYSYMCYTEIRTRSSDQWELQQHAHTGDDGLRYYGDYPMVAIGTGWGGTVGDLVRVTFSDEEVLYGVVGDIKSDMHTCVSNITTAHNGCRLEFIVYIPEMCTTARRLGCMARFVGIAGYVIDVEVLY